MIQLTGRANYQRCAETFGVPLDNGLLVRLESHAMAAESAAHF